MRLTALAGGFGGAKLSHGFARLGVELSVVVNVADDVEVHGLHVAPDLDTVMYTLAGIASPETGWGVRDETWSATAMLERYGAPTWFRLGDRDLATSVLRTQWLGQGATLTEVTARLAAALAIVARVLPSSDDPIRTKVRTAAGWIDFQDYFVRRRHADDVLALRFDGAPRARPTPAVLAAIAGADILAFAPSNPFVSIGPILAIPGLPEALRKAEAPLVAVSPIVAGAALRGPADRMFVTLGGEASALGVARHYATLHPGLVDGIVIDRSDADQAGPIEALGIRAHVADAVMTDEAGRARLAAEVVDFADRLRDGRPQDAPAEAERLA